MSNIQTKFILAGALAGKTVTLGNLPYRFKEGELLLSGPAQDVALHAKFLERNWQAYPEGHEKLKEAQDGERDIHSAEKQNAEPAVQGDVQPNGAGTDAGEQTDEGAGATEGQAGETGSVAEGDGHAPELNEKLQRAVLALDPKNDDHWTKDGQPAMSAVEKLYGSSDITRAQVKAAAPDFDREAAKQKQ